MPRKYVQRAEDVADGVVVASMRPGRMPRKYRSGLALKHGVTVCFNEAGADAPEIHVNARY